MRRSGEGSKGDPRLFCSGSGQDQFSFVDREEFLSQASPMGQGSQQFFQIQAQAGPAPFVIHFFESTVTELSQNVFEKVL